LADLDTNAELRAIIKSLLAMGENSVRPSHQNAPIYKGEEYATVLITGEAAEGTDEIAWQDIPGETQFANEHLSGTRRVSATIQYYNGNAYRQLRLLADRFQSAIGTQLLEDASMGFVVSNVQDLTGLLSDEEWQTRAVMRFEFYIAVDDLIRTPLIVKAPPISTALNNGLTRTSEVTA